LFLPLLHFAPLSHMAGQAQVLRDLGSGWQECLDSQGVFYFNSLTGQSEDSLPQGVAGASLVYQHQQVAAQVQPAQYTAAPYPATACQLQGVQAQPLQEEATVKMTVGVWSVCEDQQGEYYHNGTTGQTFDSPPPEFVELLQGSQWAAHDAPVYQAQAAPVYQSSVSQGVPVYHTASVAQGLSVYRTPGAQGAPVYQVSTVAQHAPVQQTVPINSTVALTTATTSPAVFHVASADQSPMLQMSSSQLNPQYVHHQPTHQQSLSVYPAAPGPSPQHVSQGVYKPAGDHAQVHSVRSNMNPCC